MTRPCTPCDNYRESDREDTCVCGVAEYRHGATCPSVYPPSADAPHDGPGWSGPLRCVLSRDHQRDRHWNSGINWTSAPQQCAESPLSENEGAQP